MRANRPLLVAAVLVMVGAVVGAGVMLAGRGDGGASATVMTVAAPVPQASAPTVAGTIDAAGRASVVWPERSGGRWSLHASTRAPGGGWSAPEAVVAGSEFQLLPARAASNSRGDVALLWRALGDRGRAVLYAAVRPAGGTWTNPQAVSRATWFPTADIAIDDAGTAVVAGAGLAGPGLQVTERSAAGLWTPLERLTPAGLGVDAPVISSAGDRTVVVALLKRPGRPGALWAAAREGARWRTAGVLPGSDHARGARIVSGAPPGSAFAVWEAEAPGSSRTRLMAAAGVGGVWRRPADLGPVVTPGAATPVASPDAEGAYLAWTGWDGDPADRRVALRVARVGADGVATGPRTAAVLGAPGSAASQGFAPGVVPPPGLVASTASPQVLALQEHGPRGGPAPVLTRGADGTWTRSLVPHPGATAVAFAVGTTPAGDPLLLWGEALGARPRGRILVSEVRG